MAGRFYPGNPAQLVTEVADLLAPGVSAPRRATVLVGPHAGWVYSGRIAGETYARVEVPEVAIVLCPNHTGLGARRALWPRGTWELPGDSVPVDEALAALLLARAGLEEDRAAHLREHSLEVHLPFLRARRPDVSIVPVCLGPLSAQECGDLGRALGRAVVESGRDVLVVASTDMSHYLAADEARALDQLALDAALRFDAPGLFDVVRSRDISMCGVVPTTVALHAAAVLGATRGELVRYGSSGDVTGDHDRVVGYAGMIFE